MAESTAIQFITLLEKSELLSSGQLESVRGQWKGESAHADGPAIARQLVKGALLTRWQAEQLLAGHTSFFLGKYRLLERIGGGGMGAVYKARHTVMDREVALKVMAPSLLNDAQAVARFEREVRAAATLNHPNIVAAYDADRVGQRHFLVMEYVDGHDLTHWLRPTAPVPIPWACECIRQAAIGLQHAHEHGMVHRDLKPSNLLVATGGRDGRFVVKILDMGLARFTSAGPGESGLTHSGQIMGTPDYMAPEQINDPKGADIRADIYSIGCTLFQLLTRRTPFRGETLMAKLMARMNASPPSAKAIRADIPQELDELIGRMMAVDPANRFGTPQEVAAAIGPFSSHGSEASNETLRIARPVETPATPASSDPKLNEFLKNLAAQSGRSKRTPTPVPHAHAKVRAEAPGTDTAKGTSDPAHAEGRIETESVRPRWPLIAGVAGIAAVLVAVVGFLLSRGGPDEPTPVADSAESSDPESETRPSGASTAANEERIPRTGSDSASQSAPRPPRPIDGSNPPTAKPANAAPASVGPSGQANTASDPGVGAANDAAKAADAAAGTSGPGAASGTETNSAPASTPAPAAKEPQTLIVGTAPGSFSDLKAAFEKAVPGDRIVIRHRGPLDFEPVDLTGKTPLTIEGDSVDGVDFWPILRQAEQTANAPSDAPPIVVPSLFFSRSEMNLTLRKVHLAASGEGRAELRSLFEMPTGRIELDGCSITVCAQGRFEKPTDRAIAVVRGDGQTEGPITVHLRRLFARGQGLDSLVTIEGAHPVVVDGEQVLWAGSAKPWIVLRDSAVPHRFTLNHCTIYNASSLLARESSEGPAVPKVEAAFDHCLVVGPYANPSPVIDWKSGSLNADFASDVAAGAFAWLGGENVFHRYPGFHAGSRQKPPADLANWHRLWGREGAGADRMADPMFRVWPDGFVLHEVESRDFRPRTARGKRTDPRSAVTDVGPDLDALPDAPSVVSGSGIPMYLVPNPELASQPRGRRRVLRVHARDGPYKTLESAFAELGEDDVIEIADDGPYRPSRNFVTHPASAVLFAPNARFFTLRAADDANPTIILDESAQQGVPQDATLLTLFLPSAYSARIDGVHFRFQTGLATRRAALQVRTAYYVRFTNCTCLDGPGGLNGQVNGGGTDHFAIGAFLENNTRSIWWFENDAFWGPMPAARVVVMTGNGPTRMRIQGSVCEGSFLRKHKPGPFGIATRANTFLGIVAEATDGGQVAFESADDNLVLVPTGLSLAKSVPMPAPSLTSPPRFEGASSPKDPYRGYRLRKGQPAITMAADGGPIGARVEYLPTWPEAR